MALWRLTAAGWRPGPSAAAARSLFWRLADLEPSPGLETVEPGHEVCRDRWINARLSELRPGRRAPAAADRPSEWLRLATAEQAATPEAYARFLELFGGQPAATASVRRPRGCDRSGGQRLEAEQLWRRRPPKVRRSSSAEAAAQLARLLDQPAAPTKSRAAVPLSSPNVGPTNPASTAKPAANSPPPLPPNSPTQARLKPHPWPPGQTQVKQAGAKGGQLASHRQPLPLSGVRSAAERLWIEYDPQQRRLFGVGPHGDTQWEYALGEQADVRFGYNYSPALNYACNAGNLWFVQLGYQQFALDALGAADGSPKLLWKRDLLEAQPGLSGNLGFQARPQKLAWGQVRNVPSDALGQVGQPAALAGGLVCQQQQRAVFATDTRTGAVVWRRTGFSQGCTIVGDDELLFVLDPTAGIASVLQTADGSLVERRAAPRPQERMAALGREMLVWDSEPASPRLALLDLATGATRWQRELEPGAQAHSPSWQTLAVLTPSGKFQLLSLPAGETLIEAQVDAQPSIEEFRVLRLGPTWVLLVNRGWTADDDHRPQPALSGALRFSGRCYAYDERGAELWTRTWEGLSIALPQPEALPVLTLVANFTEQPPNQNRSSAWHTLQTLDTRTGAVLAEVPKTGGPVRKLTSIADPLTRKLNIETSAEGLEITFPEPSNAPR
ncbi:MAG: PQQ-binding-like beta-propeller repeat protein [Pirellulales bacterium]